MWIERLKVAGINNYTYFILWNKLFYMASGSVNSRYAVKKTYKLVRLNILIIRDIVKLL